MAIKTRKTGDAMLFALVQAFNAFKDWVTENLTSQVHADVTSATSGDHVAPYTAFLLITAADASSLSTAITLANQAKDYISLHYADTYAHKAADTTNAITSADASDQSTLNTLLNEIKGDHNAHRSQSGVHYTNDAGNAIVAANATDAASSQTLATAVKTAHNAHIQLSVNADSIDIVDA